MVKAEILEGNKTIGNVVLADGNGQRANISAGNLSVIQTLAPAERVGDQVLVSANGLSIAASTTEDTYVIDCRFYSKKTLLIDIAGSNDVTIKMKVGNSNAVGEYDFIPSGSGFIWTNLALGKHAIVIPDIQCGYMCFEITNNGVSEATIKGMVQMKEV